MTTAVNTSSVIKPLTWQEFERSKETDVWVLNKTGAIRNNDGTSGAGAINLGVTNAQGKQTVVTIQYSIAPQDLTTQATKRAMVDSPDFKRLFNKRFFTIISSKDAQSMLKDSRIRAAYDKMVQAIDEDGGFNPNASNEARAFQAQAGDEDDIDGSIRVLVSNDSDMSEDDRYDNLEMRIESLTEKELRYIVENSSSERIKSLCAQQIIQRDH